MAAGVRVRCKLKKTIGAVAGVGAVQKSFWGAGMGVVGKTTKGGVCGCGRGFGTRKKLDSVMAVGAAHKKDACGCAVRLLPNIST